MEIRSIRIKLLLLALIFSSSMAFVVPSGNELRYPDETEYHDLAVALSEGRGFVTADGRPTVYRPPGYPVFLSVVYRVNQSPLAAKVANVLCLVWAAWVLSVLVGRLNPAGAVVSLGLVVFYPLFAYASSTLFPQLLGSALFLSSLLVVTAWPTQLRSVLLGGLIFGCLALTIPAFLLVLPGVLFLSR